MMLLLQFHVISRGERTSVLSRHLVGLGGNLLRYPERPIRSDRAGWYAAVMSQQI